MKPSTKRTLIGLTWLAALAIILFLINASLLPGNLNSHLFKHMPAPTNSQTPAIMQTTLPATSATKYQLLNPEVLHQLGISSPSTTASVVYMIIFIMLMIYVCRRIVSFTVKGYKQEYYDRQAFQSRTQGEK